MKPSIGFLSFKGHAILLLSLFLLLGTINASSIITLVTPDPTSNEIFFYFWVNQTNPAPGTGINAGGTPDNNYYSLCVTNDTGWGCYDSSIFQFSCSGGTTSRDICIATVSLRGTNRSAPVPANVTTGFTCVTPSNKVLIGAWAGSTPNCASTFGSSFSEVTDLAWLGGNVYWWNGAAWVARFNPAGGSSWCWKDVVNDGAGYFRFNKEACVVCNPGQRMCAGDNSGNELHCVDGQWEGFLPCAKGGYVNCKGGDITKCSGITLSVVIANKERVINRISIRTDKGYTIPFNSANESYWLVSGQKIMDTSFRLIDSSNFKDYLISVSDTFNVNYEWNVAEVNCITNAGVDVRNYEDSYYMNKKEYDCSLISGVSSSIMNITVTANLTSDENIALLNGTIYKQFTVQVVRDTPLMDNFQVINVNSSHIALSGHIIAYSDLSEIPESSHPFAYVNYTIYDPNTNTIKFNGASGQINASDSNYFYGLIPATGQANGDRYIVNISVGADNYANWTYLPKMGYVSPYRVLYFKCTNHPKNTTYNVLAKSTDSVGFQCTFKLENETAINGLNLSYYSRVYQPLDISAGLFGTYSLPYLTSSVIESIISQISNPLVANPSIWVNVTYVNTVGYILQYVSYGLKYVQLDSSKNRMEISNGRYVLPETVLDNPNFYQVKTYTDITVEPSNPFNFYFPESGVKLNQTSYNENDSVSCVVTFYDPYDMVKAWKVDFSGDNVFSFDSSYSNRYANETMDFTGFNCTGALYQEGRKCTGVFQIAHIQECTNKQNNSNNCYAYKFKLFNSGGTRKLTCTVTLYPVDNVDGVSRSATAIVIVTSNDFFGQIWNDWWWLIILIIIIAVIYFIRSASRPQTNINIKK